MIFTKNKKFKKMRNVVTSLVLAAAIGAAPMSAFAEGYMYDFIQQGVSSNDEIKVLRNTQYITFDDVQPTMVNDRVMVPFRTVLEQMGARVDYYPETNYVAASRGQTSIGFFLDGTTVYRQDPLGESEYVMEVAPTLVNDRTLVSIRFLSEALGLHVGWDDNTVVIFDPLDFVNTAEKVMPNLMSTESLPKFEYAEQDVDLTLDLSLPDEKTGAPSSAKVDTKAQVQKQGENVSITTTSDVVSTLSDGTNLNMRGVVLDVIKTPDAMYV